MAGATAVVEGPGALAQQSLAAGPFVAATTVALALAAGPSE